MGPVRSSTVPAQLPKKHNFIALLSSRCWKVEIILKLKQSLSSQVPSHSWVERVHTQVKCLAPKDSAAPQQPRPVPETSRSKAAGSIHGAITPCMYVEYTFRYRNTEGGHCQRACPQWVFFHCPNQWRCRDGTAIHMVMRAKRDTPSPVLKGEKPSTSLSRTGPRTACERRTRYHRAIVPSVTREEAARTCTQTLRRCF